MSTPFRFTKIKIAAGYLLLLLVFFVALWSIHRGIETLSAIDTQQALETDSLSALLREKDENMLDVLRTLTRMNERFLPLDDLKDIIHTQDTVTSQQRVQHKVIITTDSLINPVPKKGFFRRLGEVFAPTKDTAKVLNIVQELTIDTLLQDINPADSLHEKLLVATEHKRESIRIAIQQDAQRIRRSNQKLTARIDTLLKDYEEELVAQIRTETEKQQTARQQSNRIIGGVVFGAIFLAAMFVILIWRDITRGNKYRKELEEANRRYEDLLETREKLMLTITHDFKAPLGSIIGYIDLMQQLPVDNRQQFYLNNMKGSSSHLLKLVNDLLDFHRLDLNKAEINRATFNPEQLFGEVCASFQPLAGAKGLSIHYNISPELNGRFISDPLRIRQIVNNLLSNAVKFTAKGSVTLQVAYAESRLQITVSDTGKGMALKDKERIFQEFTRLPGAQGEEGFGLGLSIVAKLVHLLEGNIRVESTEGKGSSFIVDLPLFPVKGHISGKMESEKVKGADVVSSSNKPLRILLIDDDKIQLNLTSAMLEQKGIIAVCCEQLEELTEYLRRENFDLLLTDVQMPAINGFDLLTLLRASNIPQAHTIPVIAVTARSEMKEKDFLQHGFAGYLIKPFTLDDLFAVMNKTATVENTSGSPDLPEQKDGNALNFSALTAFSEGDEAAAHSILDSFIIETAKNVNTLRSALNDNDVERIAAMAHKLSPLLTLIGATNITPLLAWLEEQRGTAFSDEIKQKTEQAVVAVEQIIVEAKDRLG